jgi:hypothetical protein
MEKLRAEQEKLRAEQEKLAKLKEQEKYNKALLGRHVCSTFDNGANGWCGDVTQILGDSVRIENYRVFCKKGGFLGICTNIRVGQHRLFTDNSGDKYKNPASIIVHRTQLDK